jgi:hypothetical protein
MKLPSIYYNNNEDYITIPAIKQFIISHPNNNFKMSLPRDELLEQILKYADKDDKNMEEVLQWVDNSIQEGIIDIHIESVKLDEKIKSSLRTDDDIISFLSKMINPGFDKHICQNTYTKDFVLINAILASDSLGVKLVFVFCKKLRVHNKYKMHTKVVDYPVTAEYYIEAEWLLIKAKPRSNLYVFEGDTFNIETAKSTTTEKQIQEVRAILIQKLDLEENDKKVRANLIKNHVFYLLHQYTKTPNEISTLITQNQPTILNITDSVVGLCNCTEQCSIPQGMKSDILEDINNIVEKYLSINWSDKNIFIQDRSAYPIKLSATDEEESKVEQSAAVAEPLQTKALFFDNKKMLYKSEMCDGVVLQWKRINSKYFPTDSFKVKISVNAKGACIFKFSEYTSQEDIENVVFSLIRAKRVLN